MASDPGVSSAPPTPCSTRAPMSTPILGANPHSGRGQREPDHADQEHPAAAEPVAERAAEQDQPGQRERVAVDRPLQPAQRGVQVPADGGQRDVDHGRVEERHARAEHRGRQHPAAATGAQAQGRGGRVRGRRHLAIVSPTRLQTPTRAPAKGRASGARARWRPSARCSPGSSGAGHSRRSVGPFERVHRLDLPGRPGAAGQAALLDDARAAARRPRCPRPTGSGPPRPCGSSRRSISSVTGT